METDLGYSWVTPIKQHDYRNFLNFYLRIVKHVMDKNNWTPRFFYYFDINAGPGKLGDNIGSPLIYLDCIKNLKIKHVNYFIDLNKDYCKELYNHIGDTPSFIVSGDNDIILKDILYRIPVNSLGLIYHDPNGAPNFELMKWCAKYRKKLDILIRVNSTQIKRNKSVFEDRDALIDSICFVDKKKWIIKELIPSDRWQWTFLFGTNFINLNDWKKQGWYDIKSSKGTELLNKCNLTNGEMKNGKMS